jgi:hypothetical protein
LEENLGKEKKKQTSIAHGLRTNRQKKIGKEETKKATYNFF